VNTRKSFLVVVMIFILLMSSVTFTFGENGNNNLYPNPQPGIGTINEQMLQYPDQYNVTYGVIAINGPSVKGSVNTKMGNEKGMQALFTLEVKEEGMVSINLETSNSIDDAADLSLLLGMNDPRKTSDTVGNNMDVQTKLYDRENKTYVQKNYIYYAYPGTYYFRISGKDRNGSGYVPLPFTISATQEIYAEQFGDAVSDKTHPDYPNFLGATTLVDELSIRSTKSMKNWREPRTSGISGPYTNSADNFTFTASKTGTVHMRLSNNKTPILDTFLAAYHSSVNSKTFVPKLNFNILEVNVGYPLRTEVLYGGEKNEAFEVKAGVTYQGQIIGSNHPMSYALDLSYNQGEMASGISGEPSSWAVEEINQSVVAGLKTTKMMNSDYKSYATREEFAELVMRLYDKLGGESVAGGQNPFIDTTNDEIIRAQKSGIINGTSASTFSPNANLTREQLCVMILRTLQLTGISYSDNGSFQKNYSDTQEISPWALNSVKVLNSYEIINGSGESLAPKNNVTKEEAILMMYRAYKKFN